MSDRDWLQATGYRLQAKSLKHEACSLKRVSLTGFTLVEVLASVGILVTFLTAAMVSFNATQNLSENSQQQGAVLQAAKGKFEEIRASNFSGLLDWYNADAEPNGVYENRIFTPANLDGKGNIRFTDVSNQYSSAGSFSGERAWHASFVYKDRIWVLGGRFSSGAPTNDIQRWNGTQWDAVAFDTTVPYVSWAPREGLGAVVYNDDMLVLGGWDNSTNTYYNDVYLMDSGDPSNNDPANDLSLGWTQQLNAQWTPRYGHAAVVFQNKIWVLGGRDDDPLSPGTERVLNDIWTSADGASWAQVTSAAPWTARSNHTAVVFNNQLWVIGGEDINNSPVADPIWYSNDGQTWTPLTPIVPDWATGPYYYEWKDRFAHAAAVFGGRIWIVGGNLGGTLLNDLWWTDDVDFTDSKQTWIRGTDNVWGASGGRQGHSAVVYEDKLWLLGGIDANGFSNGASWSYGAARMYQVDIVVSWRDNKGRIIGEDNGGTNGPTSAEALNGILDTGVGEDANGNGVLDSPVHITGLIANRGYPSQIYMGRE